jgi:hypothetical protein
MRRIAILTLTAMVLGITFIAGTLLDTSPECPTEDSCTVDYTDGEWVITPEVP